MVGSRLGSATALQLGRAGVMFTGLNLLALTFTREFAPISLRSIFGLLVLGAETSAGIYLSAQAWRAIWEIERSASQWLAPSAYHVPNLSSIFWLVAAPVALSRWYVRRDPLHLGLAAAAVLVGIGLYQSTYDLEHAPWLFGGALALVATLALSAYRDAFSDALTHLPGRMLLDQNLAKLGHRYAVALMDVDLLRRFNHRYGHAVGDQVLRFISARLRQRFGDNAYHFGGEEFCVIFPGLSRRFALGRCDAFRKEIAHHDFMLRRRDRSMDGNRGRRGDGLRKRGVRVTVSIGLAHRDAHHTTSAAVMAAADKALHRAKLLGRNLVVEQKALR